LTAKVLKNWERKGLSDEKLILKTDLLGRFLLFSRFSIAMQ
jgi:hypothetical protein